MQNRITEIEIVEREMTSMVWYWNTRVTWLKKMSLVKWNCYRVAGKHQFKSYSVTDGFYCSIHGYSSLSFLSSCAPIHSPPPIPLLPSSPSALLPFSLLLSFHSSHSSSHPLILSSYFPLLCSFLLCSLSFPLLFLLVMVSVCHFENKGQCPRK